MIDNINKTHSIYTMGNSNSSTQDSLYFIDILFQNEIVVTILYNRIKQKTSMHYNNFAVLCKSNCPNTLVEYTNNILLTRLLNADKDNLIIKTNFGLKIPFTLTNLKSVLKNAQLLETTHEN